METIDIEYIESEIVLEGTQIRNFFQELTTFLQDPT